MIPSKKGSYVYTVFMTILLSIQNLVKAYGSKNLFDDLSFSVYDHQKIGIVGPNGSGKSTLLRIIQGIEEQDGGQVIFRKGLTVAYAAQQAEILDLELSAYRRSLFGFPYDIDPRKLSGGQKRKFLIAKALDQEPSLLLLDEPTNHLDLEGILWLEELLNSITTPMLIVSHDRVFLDRVTNATLEINHRYPKGHFFVEGPYSTYLKEKEAFELTQSKRHHSLEMELKKQLEWLGRTAPARTAKSVTRIKDVGNLKEEVQNYKERNQSQGKMAQFTQSDSGSKKLIVLKHVFKTYGEKTLFEDFNIEIMRKDRLGVLGMNGSGKSTLLKILLKELAPDKGTVKWKEDLRVVYFDQMKEGLPKTGMTLHEALAGHLADTVIYQDKPMHIVSWARKFRFPSDRLGMDIEQLSGGERARTILARLMLKPADVLLLDEPTNDLDMEMIDLLTTSLQDFEGAVVVISHDRYFLNSIATQYIGLGVPSDTGYLFSDFQQWQQKLDLVKKEGRAEAPSRGSFAREKKRSTREIETQIEKTEEMIRQVEEKLVVAPPSELESLCKKHLALKHDLEELYQRWESLLNN
ncbi:MAG: ABC-F family ATP-binding cassette domain-containing protein [Chlamydiia bacterium]